MLSVNAWLVGQRRVAARVRASGFRCRPQGGAHQQHHRECVSSCGQLKNAIKRLASPVMDGVPRFTALSEDSTRRPDSFSADKASDTDACLNRLVVH